MVSYEAHFYNVNTKWTMELNELKLGTLSENMQSVWDTCQIWYLNNRYNRNGSELRKCKPMHFGNNNKNHLIS